VSHQHCAPPPPFLDPSWVHIFDRLARVGQLALRSLEPGRIHEDPKNSLNFISRYTDSFGIHTAENTSSTSFAHSKAIKVLLLLNLHAFLGPISGINFPDTKPSCFFWWGRAWRVGRCFQGPLKKHFQAVKVLRATPVLI